jgi:hypothetical protein
VDRIAPKPKAQNDTDPKRRPWLKHVRIAAYELWEGDERDRAADPHRDNIAAALHGIDRDDPALTQKIARVVRSHLEQSERPARLATFQRWIDRLSGWNPNSEKQEDFPETIAREFAAQMMLAISGIPHGPTEEEIEAVRQALVNGHRHRTDGLDAPKRKKNTGRALMSAGLRGLGLGAKTVDRMLDGKGLGAPRKLRKSGRAGESG